MTVEEATAAEAEEQKLWDEATAMARGETPEPEAEIPTVEDDDLDSPAPEADEEEPDVDDDQSASEESEDEPPTTEALQAEIERLRQQAQSSEGRYKATERQLRELREKNNPPPPEAGEDEEDHLGRVMEEYPDVAGPLVQELNAVKSTLQSFHDANSEAEQARREKEGARLVELVPNAAEIIGQTEEEVQKFWDWVEDQPRIVRETAHENRDAIVNADAAASVLTAFEQFQSGKATTEEPKPKDEKRERQKAGARSTSVKSGQKTVQKGLPDDADDDAVFAHATNLARKSLGLR